MIISNHIKDSTDLILKKLDDSDPIKKFIKCANKIFFDMVKKPGYSTFKSDEDIQAEYLEHYYEFIKAHYYREIQQMLFVDEQFAKYLSIDLKFWLKKRINEYFDSIYKRQNSYNLDDFKQTAKGIKMTTDENNANFKRFFRNYLKVGDVLDILYKNYLEMDIQIQCFVEAYFKDMTLSYIAKKHNLSKRTVIRYISKVNDLVIDNWKY